MLSNSMIRFLRTLKRISDLYDSTEIADHGGRTRLLALEIGKRLTNEDRLDEDALEILGYAAELHDFGKIFISRRIYRKQGSLDPDEFLRMSNHCERGYRALELSGVPIEIRFTIRYHMERWDGSGYPEGRRGLDIPLFSRIVAIADVYDALTSDRPYRKAYKKELALEIMNRMTLKFDPTLYTIFLQQLREVSHG